MSGEVVNLRPEEFYGVAQYGYTKFQEEQNNRNKPQNNNNTEPVELTTEDRIVQLQQKIESLEQGNVQREQHNQVLNTLAKLADSKELTKTNTKFADMAGALSLAQLNLNPRLNLEKVYNDTVKLFEEVIASQSAAKVEEEVKKIAINNKVQHSMIPSIRGSGGTPSIDNSKKYTPEDVNTGVSRRALAELVARLSTE